MSSNSSVRTEEARTSEEEETIYCKICEKTEEQIEEWKYFPGLTPQGVCQECYDDTRIQDYKRLMSMEGLNGEYPLIRLHALEKEYKKRLIHTGYINEKLSAFCRDMARIEVLKQKKIGNEKAESSMESKIREYQYRVAGAVITGNMEGLQDYIHELDKWQEKLMAKIEKEAGE